MTASLRVTGGAGGIVAHCEEIAELGRRFGAAASQTLHAAWSLHGYLLDPALLTSAVLDPAGFAAFETALVAALDGPGGLSWAGARAGVLDGGLRLAAVSYETADRLAARAHDELFGVLDLPAAVAAGARGAVTGRSPLAAAELALSRDPAAADVVVGLLGLPAVLRAGAGTMPDGTGVARPLGPDRGGSAGRPPRRLSDIVRDLARRDEDTHHGAIDVRVLTLPDGTRRVVVDVTGTKSWDPGRTSDVTSLTTNARALVGRSTAYEQGVLAAMTRAGVRPEDPVMLVGHSEGGMVAVEAARDALAGHLFDVTHVVTLGSPVGLTVGALPRSVQVLALENARDVVPHLDGVENPDEPNVTTVTAAAGDGTVSGDHGITSAYLPISRETQRSGNVSIRAFLHSTRDWFRGVRVRTHTFQVVRRY